MQIERKYIKPRIARMTRFILCFQNHSFMNLHPCHPCNPWLKNKLKALKLSVTLCNPVVNKATRRVTWVQRLAASVVSKTARMVKAPSPWERVGVRLSVVGLCLLLLTACTQGDLMFRGDNVPTALVIIRPDMSTHTLPAQKYYFYNTNGTTACQQFSCDGFGNFSGSLSAGSYRVIASNAIATGAIYKNMDAYETAMVCADNLHTRSVSCSTSHAFGSEGSAPDSRADFVSLGRVYRVVPEPFTINANDTIHHTATPELLTRTLTLSFSLASELQSSVIALSGTLPGIYPSVHLATGKTVDTEIARAPELSMDYAARASDNRWVASISLFGLCDPKHGEIYQNTSTITLTTVDGSSHQVQIDLTDSLSDILENYDGALPIDIPVQINVELELKGIGVAGSVTSWSYVSGGSEVVVPV